MSGPASHYRCKTIPFFNEMETAEICSKFFRDVLVATVSLGTAGERKLVTKNLQIKVMS